MSDVPPPPPPGGSSIPSSGSPLDPPPPTPAPVPPAQAPPPQAPPPQAPPPQAPPPQASTMAAPGPGPMPGPSGPKPPSNGVAVAALVCGILSFICLGPIAGVLAIIFGLLGLGKAKELGVGRGMAMAGLILGVIGTVLSTLILVIVLVAAGDAAEDVANDIGGIADPETYELETGTCEVDQFGFATFTGTIENTSDEMKNFNVDGEFRNAANDNVLESTNDIVIDLPAGDTAEWSMTASVNDATSVSCRVLDVENYFN